MSVTPQTLPSIDSSAHWHALYEYRWRATSSNIEIYGLWNLNSNVWQDQNFSHSIRVNTTTNTWEDNGSENPTSVIEGPDGSISLYKSDGMFLYKFTKPTTASWIGSGTSTEGSSYSGTLTVNGTSLEYEIPVTSSSGTYELKADGTIQLLIVHGSTASTGSAPNFDQTKIWTLISPMGDELDEIDLTGIGGSLTKKVFCNFW